MGRVAVGGWRPAVRRTVLASALALAWPQSQAHANDLLEWLRPAPTWSSVSERIAKDHPQVKAIELDELRKWLEAPGREQPLLVDTRSADEYAVSHLPGALHAETPEAVQRLMQRHPGRAVVLYCSVGVRSARVADVLRSQVDATVLNFEGSIFTWANRGLAVEHEGRPVDRVHPFDARWGKLLDRGRWSHEP